MSKLLQQVTDLLPLGKIHVQYQYGRLHQLAASMVQISVGMAEISHMFVLDTEYHCT